MSLWRSADQISVYLPDAHKEQFIKTDGSWHNQINGKEKYRLSEQIDGYELKDLETCHSYHFDIEGHIRVICDAYGNRTSYTYVGKLLSVITLESGISLYLTYEGERLSLLRDSQGREYHYRYEGDLLTEVTYPKGLVCRGRRNPHKTVENPRVCRRWHNDRTDNENHRIVRTVIP